MNNESMRLECTYNFQSVLTLVLLLTLNARATPNTPRPSWDPDPEFVRESSMFVVLERLDSTLRDMIRVRREDREARKKQTNKKKIPPSNF